MSAALINMAATVTRGKRASRAAEHVLALHVDEALFDKVKRREHTRCIRPANKYWNDRLDGVAYTHIKLTTNAGRSMRIIFKGAVKRRCWTHPDRGVTLWEVAL